MPGGEVQLVAYGEENMFLNDDPQITFFKIIYRRYTILVILHKKVICLFDCMFFANSNQEVGKQV